jgi:hypothetical protein
MPKISEQGGPSYRPITEEQYTQAMEKHGTPDFTEEDRMIVERWNDQQAKKEGERPSDGNSSRASSDSEQTNTDRTEANPQSPARTTENPSSQGRTGNSTAQQTGGSGTAKSSTGDKSK